MSEILKTITAHFETVDLAELAAKNIKNNFLQVKAITIKYKNIPQVYHVQDNYRTNPTETAAYLTAAAIGSGMATSFAGGYPGFLPIGGKTFMQVAESGDLLHNRPEPERSTESRLIIKANESLMKRIESHLRSMGGQHITIS